MQISCPPNARLYFAVLIIQISIFVRFANSSGVVFLPQALFGHVNYVLLFSA